MLLGGILLTKSKSMEFLVSARTCQPSFGLEVYIFLVADMNNKFKNEIEAMQRIPNTQTVHFTNIQSTQ